jgi:sugar-phosphatase
MIKGVVFDMDGILIDSEPYWQEEERNAFRTVGIEITPGMQVKTHGVDADEVVKYWYNYQPWENISHARLKEMVFENVEKQILQKGKAMTGVSFIIDFFKRKKIPLALASSSPRRLINVVLKKLDLNHAFTAVCSAEEESHSKPHPAVYLTAAKKLQVQPVECMAFEDSVNGMIAAKAARMKTIVIPENKQRNNKAFGLADLKINSLLEFNEEHFINLNDNY